MKEYKTEKHNKRKWRGKELNGRDTSIDSFENVIDR